MPKGRLKERMAKFCAGEWTALLEACLDAAVAGASAQGEDEVRKTHRSAGRQELLGFAPMGTLSSARQASEGAAVAPRDDNTWKAFFDETKRPRMSRVPLDDRVLNTNPSELLQLEFSGRTFRNDSGTL